MLLNTNIFIATALFTTSAAVSYVNANDSYTKPIRQESRRVEVYSLSQNYWDTQYGETLGGIVLHLLPNTPAKRQSLKKDIVLLNPHAFINGDHKQLLAHKRL